MVKLTTDNSPDKMIFIKASDIKPEDVVWLWNGWIPMGKLSILEGDPGLGKSMLIIDLIARVSTGRSMPDEIDEHEELTCLLMAAEDGIEDTIIPRLIAANAEQDNVHIHLTNFEEAKKKHKQAKLPTHCKQLEENILELGAKFVIIDPLMAYLEGDANSDQEVRAGLHPLADVARKTGAAIVCIRHLNKRQGASALNRGSGSIGITATARSVFQWWSKPNGANNERILVQVKNNLAKMPVSLEAKVIPYGLSAKIEWIGPVDINAEQAAGNAKVKKVKPIEPVEWLATYMEKGECPSIEVERASKEAGISTRALNAAKDKLGIGSKVLGKLTKGGYWVYYYK